ncbi:MAG TPA: sodium:alanine symporter family protein [Candidatus Faecousia intestinigallinarum]|nr:sodium:alanine symporter family protein [Candidatus Faecousia intestinigallinarum]
MNAIVSAIETANGWINDFVWGVPVLLLILGTGLYYTVRLGFLQFRHPVLLFRETVGKAFRKKDEADRKPGEVTSFQAAMTSVGAIVGSGNIAGVATAIVMGGPGVLVWMILAALVGMATKFAEIALGMRYREVRPDGSVGGGAMYYLAKGLKQRWLGVFFSLLVIPYAFVISAVVDSNTIALTLNDRYALPTWVSGLVLAVLAAIVILGGVKRIGRASEIIAPFMGGLYILAGIAVILLHLPQVPEALGQVIQGAFDPQAVTGGAVGSVFIAMRYGIARGIYSNEAGLGTAAMVHSSAKVEHPVEQAMWEPVEVFLDTVLVCTVTALTIVFSGLWDTGLDGAVLTMRAFEATLPGGVGGIVCTASVVLFGFTCLISFYTYAERAAVYIFGDRSRLFVKILWVLMIFVGSQTTLGLAWDLADTINGLMIIPNLVGLILLSGEVAKLKKEYFGRLAVH